MHISKEEKMAELERILHGRSLHGAESLRAFLRFVVDQSLDHQESGLKEYVIATQAFGRGPDFDSRIDSVVRVQAGRLRTKLQEYYATEGKDDRIIIDLPKGQYVPVFSYAPAKEEQRTGDETVTNGGSIPANGPPSPQASAGPASALDPLPLSAAPDVTEISQTGKPSLAVLRRWQTATLSFALLAVLLGTFVFFYRARAAELSMPTTAGAPGETDALDPREIAPLWGDLLRSAEPILVVYSNTLFRGTAEGGMKLLKKLDSPGSSLGSPIIPQSEMEQSKEPVIEHYTGIGEVMGAYYLGDFFARTRHASRLKRSLLLTWEDLKTENIVVLGSPAENFFLRDLPQKQDLVFKPMPDDNGNKSFGIINTNVQPGEQPRYFARQDGPSRSQISEDYAVVSLLQGLDGKKRMLILAGITTLGTQAAAEYVTKPDYIRDLISRLNTAPAGAPPKLPANFQALVKVKVNGGVPVQISYITHHVLNQ